ncbi:MAG: hypothetical protein ACK5PS_00410 [Desulfopila sp.]
MTELSLSTDQVNRVARIYQRLEEEYNKVAAALGFGCEGCPDNCCDSYFLHHTYSEWAYLRLGLGRLPAAKRSQVLARAEDYRQQCLLAQARDERPRVMCPLNEDGLCILYAERLLVCRTHGVPARMRRPDGRMVEFPGCFRCQEVVAEREKTGLKTPRTDRTALLTELAQVENELLDSERQRYPRVRLTIAEMLLARPAALPPQRGQ